MWVLMRIDRRWADSKYLLLSAVIVMSCVSRLAAAQFVQFPQGEFPLTNYQKSSVPIEEIFTGGPMRDGIPAIDSPRFVSADSASEWLGDKEPVIALQLNGVARAYPLQILMYHEIVNDELAGKPVSVTFCPLCNASIVFEREVKSGGDSTVLDFGTTGRLRKSDLVMYDRQTETWWQQFTGKGIIGDYTDVSLVRLPSQIISFEEFRRAFPESEVLSKETGFLRPYGNNPYRGYDSIDNNPFLFRGEVDPRLPAMERVLSIRHDTETQLVPLSELKNQAVVNLTSGGYKTVVIASTSATSALDAENIAQSRHVPAAAAFRAMVDEQELVFELKDGIVQDLQTASHWNAFGMSIKGELAGTQLQQVDDGVHFAFAWLAFDPEATVVKLGN